MTDLLSLRLKLQSAEASIAEVLRSLEQETGQLVEAIGLETLDVTLLGDPNPRHQMQVQIHLKRLPGHGWGT